MTDTSHHPGAEQPDGPVRERTTPPKSNQIEPLPGEAGTPDVATPAPVERSMKGMLSVGLLVCTAVAAGGMSIHRYFATTPTDEGHDSKPSRDRPASTVSAPRKLDLAGLPAAIPATGSNGRLGATPSAASAADASASGPRIPAIPAIVPSGDEKTEAIGVRRTGTSSGGTAAPKSPPPEDAPVLLVSSRPATTSPIAASAVAPTPTTSDGKPDPLAATQRNLQAYQTQLQGLMETLNRTAVAANAPRPEDSMPSPAMEPARRAAPVGPGNPVGNPPPGAGLFGGQLPASATPRVSATLLGDRSLTLPKGTAFTCALKTRVISATSGLVGCQVQRNVYSDNGRVLLIERGSHLDGEYRITSVKPGTVRIPVLWTRIRTPLGVTVDLDSPGTGPLGESGIDGHVDNRWGERIGAAMLLSLIDDSVKLVIQQQADDGGGNGGSAVVLQSTTAQTSKLAEKVLETTINIPPLIYQNQGGVVGIYVARDVDFSSVYELRPVTDETAR